MRPRPLRSVAVRRDETIASHAPRSLHGTAVHHDETIASHALRPLRKE